MKFDKLYAKILKESTPHYATATIEATFSASTNSALSQDELVKLNNSIHDGVISVDMGDVDIDKMKFLDSTIVIPKTGASPQPLLRIKVYMEVDSEQLEDVAANKYTVTGDVENYVEKYIENNLMLYFKDENLRKNAFVSKYPDFELEVPAR